MSVKPTKKRKIFGLFEDSFRDFKGDGWFPSYWTDKAGFNVALVTYKGLRANQKDTTDILTLLFAKNNLSPKSILGNPEEARKEIVKMARNDVTLTGLRHLLRPPIASGTVVPTASTATPANSGPSSTARAAIPLAGPNLEARITPERGSSNEGGGDDELLLEVSSPGRNDEQDPPPHSSSKRAASENSVVAKRQSTEGPSREFSAMDRSFDASSFIAVRLLGPKAQEALRDYDPIKSVCWAQCTLLR
ncbi:hypothetical protein PIB30_049659 [Stylosanthes scabra]|uniref:Uncharacterized protein n=1 Tax=Stylosanthes scabra TaxID=79078 RepID=A0ABU6SI83_9FABA|nr:hypothetical protein [Stylosanthes scabra]